MQQDPSLSLKQEPDQQPSIVSPPSSPLSTVEQEPPASDSTVAPQADPPLLPLFSSEEDHLDLLEDAAGSEQSSPFAFPFQPSTPMPTLVQTELAPTPPPPDPPSRRPDRKWLAVSLMVAVVLITLGGGGMLLLAQSVMPSAPPRLPGRTSVLSPPASPSAPPRSKQPTPPAQTKQPTTQPAPPPPASPTGGKRRDDFHRTDRVGGWGTATGGMDWQVTEGHNQSAFSIRGGVGQMTATQSKAAFYTATLGSILSNQITQVQVRFSMQRFSPQTNMGVIVRYHDEENYYKAYLSGRELVLMKKVKGRQTVLARIPFRAQINTTYQLRLRTDQNVLMAKAWQADQRELGWMIDQIDTSLTTGHVGVRALLLPKNQIQVFTFQATEQ